MKGPYDDIIHLPHPVSVAHPRMPAPHRAAQFSPFAALTGYDAAIAETARRTDARVVLEEDAKAALNLKLRALADAVADRPAVIVTYFQPDGKKQGGAYVTAIGAVKKVDAYERVMVLAHGEKIPIEDILHVECERFKAWDGNFEEKGG